VFEAVVVRLRRRVGVFKGFARVENETIVEGTMTFALASARGTRSAPEDADPAGPADPADSF
jgi:hypothetical protein